MLNGVTKAVNLYLIPLLSLTSFILILFTYLAPVILFPGQVSLLSVTPSTALTDSRSSDGVDGPSVFLGALGSCTRPNNGGPLTCTAPTVSPTYDLSVLPKSAPDLLSAPTATTPVFIAISLAFTIIFFILFTLTTFRSKMGKAGNVFDKPAVQRATAWIGLLGFLIGIVSFLVIRMWFGKAVEDFNRDIFEQGSNAPQLIASTANGFIMAWVGFAFYAVPVVSSLAKLHVAAGKA
ncbi:uncharacterized protein BXZ73DRAFT_39964 [Epithele typhae]|uniref:uncharacterized protein n=1 Tax=Epithele typhae TaxID=378194 RepID=UPI0020072A5C|nr:uncharacterized protein BXZ73DRAFT_39964 [Epithele typhae]KAH9944409.1 hypothetical protein BXZ73DRAFT_39964 [Epithele typhae]